MSNCRVQPKPNAPYVVGVDLGGTNVRAAVLNRNEQSLGRAENFSDVKCGVARTVKRIGEAVRNAIKDAGVKIEEVGAVGISVQGHIDVLSGRVVWAPNFGDHVDGLYVPSKNIMRRDLVEAELGFAMVMDNNANVTALGEFRYGAGRGRCSPAMFTLGGEIGGMAIEDEVFHVVDQKKEEKAGVIIFDDVSKGTERCYRNAPYGSTKCSWECMNFLRSNTSVMSDAPIFAIQQAISPDQPTNHDISSEDMSRGSNGDFDVFLCHNSHDKPAVKAIGGQLKQRGIQPWLDEWELRPGSRFQQALDQHIRRSKSAAVFVGKRGMGPWQDLEQEALLREFLKRGCQVIPVILPDCRKTPELPLFLGGMQWVDFRETDPSPLEQLIWGITGKKIYRE